MPGRRDKEAVTEFSEPETGFITLGDEQIPFSVFRSRKRRRTIAFRMEHDKSLRVLAPFSARMGTLAKILQNRAPWIRRELGRKESAPQNGFTDGAAFFYLGYHCTLRVTQGMHAPRSCFLSPRVLHVHVPDKNLSPENLEQEVRLEILLWLKKRARMKLKKRLDLWAARMDVTYRKFVISDPRHRWGSCSADDVIRLNWRLMLAPLPVIDYVVAHELAHVRHKNHSPRFWGFLARYMPDAGARRKKLRSLERGLVL